jgi:hypothetical protein
MSRTRSAAGDHHARCDCGRVVRLGRAGVRRSDQPWPPHP